MTLGGARTLLPREPPRFSTPPTRAARARRVLTSPRLTQASSRHRASFAESMLFAPSSTPPARKPSLGHACARARRVLVSPRLTQACSSHQASSRERGDGRHGGPPQRRGCEAYPLRYVERPRREDARQGGQIRARSRSLAGIAGSPPGRITGFASDGPREDSRAARIGFGIVRARRRRTTRAAHRRAASQARRRRRRRASGWNRRPAEPPVQGASEAALRSRRGS